VIDTPVRAVLFHLCSTEPTRENVMSHFKAYRARGKSGNRDSFTASASRCDSERVIAPSSIPSKMPETTLWTTPYTGLQPAIISGRRYRA